MLDYFFSRPSPDSISYHLVATMQGGAKDGQCSKNSNFAESASTSGTKWGKVKLWREERGEEGQTACQLIASGVEEEDRGDSRLRVRRILAACVGGA